MTKVGLSPYLNMDIDGLKPLRQSGEIADELVLMKERMSKLTFPKDEVTICGTGLTLTRCPFNTETWVCNIGYRHIWELDGHFSKLFLTHIQVIDIQGNPMFDWESYNKLVDGGVEIYNIHKFKALKSKQYPLKRIIKKFKTNYFTNTFCYMIAYAIDKGYQKIHMYGADMMTSSEYAWEKGGMEYWIGKAEGMGIEVNIGEGSALLRTMTGKPYGIKYFTFKDIDPDGSMRRKARKKQKNADLSQYVEQPPSMPILISKRGV